MKISTGDKIILYLNNQYIKQKKYNNEKIEDNFKDIFETLKQYYNIKINGFYHIDVYSDSNYGIIIEMLPEDIDLDYYDNQVDMKIIFHNKKFLYEIDEIEDYIHNKIYKYKDKYYIEEFNIEKSIPTYKTDEIWKYAKTIEISK